MRGEFGGLSIIGIPLEGRLDFVFDLAFKFRVGILFRGFAGDALSTAPMRWRMRSDSPSTVSLHVRSRVRPLFGFASQAPARSGETDHDGAHVELLIDDRLRRSQYITHNLL